MNSDGAFRGKTGAGGSSADGCSDDEGSDTQSGRGAERGGEEAKSKQALLHVRNLRYFGSLNQEVLELQDKLRDSMRPDVAPEQKSSVFDLIGQLLHSAIAEVERSAVDTALPMGQILEQSLGFLLAVEHTKEVAMPAEVKTQVMKHAALLDLELLCQIISGPFQQRLLSAGAQRLHPASGGARPRALGPGGERRAESWGNLVSNVCGRIVRVLREPLLGK